MGLECIQSGNKSTRSLSFTKYCSQLVMHSSNKKRNKTTFLPDEISQDGGKGPKMWVSGARTYKGRSDQAGALHSPFVLGKKYMKKNDQLFFTFSL